MFDEESTATSDDIIDGIAAILDSEQDIEEPKGEAQEEETATVTDDADDLEEKPDEELEDDSDEDESEGEEEETTQEATEDGLELSTEEFAELLGIDGKSLKVNEEGAVLIKTKVGDEEENVPLNDLIKSYQTDKHVTQKSQAVSEAQKAFEQERIDYVNQATERLNQAAGLMQVLEKEMVGDYQAVNWEQLRVTDPAEYAARRQEFSDKQNNLEAMKNQLASGAQSLTEEQNREMDIKRNEHLAEQGELLLAAIPEWNDPEVAKEEKSAIGEFMVSKYGFTDEDLQGLTDHRAILIVRDAMKYREGKTKVDVATKKVRKLPKISRPGKNKKTTNNQSKAAKARRIRLKESGSVKDAAALLYDMI